VEQKDHVQRAGRAEQALIDGLARGESLDELVEALWAIAVKADLVVGKSLISMASDVLGIGGFSSTEPLEYEGLREKYLPEIEFRGKVSHRNSQYALYAAAALRGGVLPDIIADTGWWQSELWLYALYAVVTYARASAERRGASVADVARALAAARGVSVNS